MDQGWRLGPHWYVPATPSPLPAGAGAVPGCAWEVVRRDGEGPRSLLQVWEPCPPVPVLDTLREEFLQRFSRAEPMDPGACHLGFDSTKAWFLQELGGVPLPRLWARAGRADRTGLQARIGEALEASRAPRLLVPEVIGIDPGRVLAPRILGAVGRALPVDRAGLLARLEKPPAPEGAGAGERPWDQQPEFADGSRLPLRGRSRELTYLKSLMLGLGAAIPMERVLILQGEEGLGHDRLCDWAAAAAETEGLWVADLDLYPGEAAGGLLERVLAELIAGLEADLYASLPAVARALSGRMATFAFLRGGRRSGEHAIDPEELSAALEAAAFAQARHPRLVLIRGLERAAPGVPRLLRDLVAGSGLPWLLSAREPGLGPEARSCLATLKRHPASATVILDRLEDGQIMEVLADLLGRHELPSGFLAEICAASLGNPGLLQKTLELAQGKGCILRQGGRWVCAPGGPPALEVQEDLMAGILQGRLRRLQPAALAATRYLALADQPLPSAVLGRALGLDGDALEESLAPAASAKLVMIADGCARIQGPSVRELAIARMTGREIQRSAQTLLKTLGETGGKPLLAVRLQAFALERGAALASVLEGVERERTGPLEAAKIVSEALKLGPGRLQESRLWEFQADAWGWATAGDGLSMAGPQDRSPGERALEALERALRSLTGESGWAMEEAAARLHRKKGLLELRLRRLEAAGASIGHAAALLADHPFHPEQPRLRLAQARLQASQGQRDLAVASLRSGLDLLNQKGIGAGAHDQAALLLELGRAQGEGAQFHGALATLDGVRRLAEHDGDRRMLAEVLYALGQVHMGMGQAGPAAECMQEAIRLARALDDPALVAEGHLKLGMFRSVQQQLGPALSSLESALRRFELLGDGAGAARTQVWKARNLAALGDQGLADLVLARAAGAGAGAQSPVELGERAFLDGEIAGFMDDWASARRHYQAAANRLAHAGLVWRERLARLRCIQAEAQEAEAVPGTRMEPAWIRLEQLKGPVEGTGSRWLDLEWQRAHALLLSSGPGPTPAQTLLAWGEVMAGARELKFPATVMEAGARSSELLLERGETLGAQARIHDALPSAHEWWARLPEGFGPSCLERSDLHRFRRAAEQAGMSIAWPARAEPAPDWNPITVDLSLVASLRNSP